MQTYTAAVGGPINVCLQTLGVIFVNALKALQKSLVHEYPHSIAIASSLELPRVMSCIAKPILIFSNTSAGLACLT